MSTPFPTDPEEVRDQTLGPETRSGLSKLVTRSVGIVVAAAILVIIGLAMLAFSLSGRAERPLLPLLPTFTTVPETIAYEPELIGFAELNADPNAFRGRRIQVSGAYMPVEPPKCVNYAGPTIRWSLVAEELQLNAMGFENLLRLLETSTDMTVVGVWSAYQGPLGCGKSPPQGTVWYLAVERILEPNPLLGANGPLLTVIAGQPLPTLSPLETVELVTPEVTPTFGSDTELTPTATLDAGLPPVVTPTLETTMLPVTPLPTPEATSDLIGTPPIDSTPEASATFGPSPTADGTVDAPGTATPIFPTNTPSAPGYPSLPTPTATTPGSYP